MGHRLSWKRSGAPGGEPSSGLLGARSEEHTSELQSQFHLVCRLLLEKKKHVEALMKPVRGFPAQQFLVYHHTRLPLPRPVDCAFCHEQFIVSLSYDVGTALVPISLAF